MNNFFDRSASDDKDPNTPPLVEKQTAAETSDQTNLTDKKVKETTQELLRYGYIDEARKPALLRNAVTFEAQISAALEPLDLMLKLDTHRGVAYLSVASSSYDDTDDTTAWSHPLVRRQRLTLEQSLLIALLRQAFVMHEQESGIGQSAAKISIDDLLPQFLTYFEDTGSDTKNESRLLNLLDQLKTYAIVSEVDKNQELTIRPMIAHLANPESLTALLNTFKEQAGSADNRKNE